MKKHFNFIVYKWNSFLLVFATLWLASTFFISDDYVFAILALIFSVFKVVGILTKHTGLRVIGLVGINIVWAVTAYCLFRHSIAPWELPAFMVLFGIGISLQEHFRYEN